jgi:hypothetical protein
MVNPLVWLAGTVVAVTGAVGSHMSCPDLGCDVQI